MSQGVANIVTLYDKDGNAVQVVLEDGQHRLRLSDDLTHERLDEIRLLLAQLLERLTLGT